MNFIDEILFPFSFRNFNSQMILHQDNDSKHASKDFERFRNKNDKI